MNYSQRAAQTGQPTFGYQLNFHGSSSNNCMASQHVGGGMPVMSGTKPDWTVGIGAQMNSMQIRSNGQSFASKPNFEVGATLNIPLGGRK